MMRQGRQGRRRRRQRELDRADLRRDGARGVRALPADRRQPLSLRQERPRRADGGFRPAVRAGRRHRRFFSTNLAPLVNLTGKTWTWRPNPNLTRKLSDTTLRQFQQAAEIRDAFFPTGGAQPNVTFDVKPLTLSSDAQTGDAFDQRRDRRRSAERASAGVDRAMARRAAPRAASIAMAPDMPDRKSNLERTGAWALFRLVDAGSVDPERQRGQGQLRRRRPRSLVSSSPPPRSTIPSSMPFAAAVQMPQRIVRSDDRAGLFGKLPGQARLRRRQRAAALSRGLGALAAGGRRDLAADARRGLDAKPTIARRSGASGSAPTFAAKR